VWEKIKELFAVVGALIVAIVIGVVTGRSRSDRGRTSSERVRDAIGSHDERAGEIDRAERSMEHMERESERSTSERDELEQRTSDSAATGRGTIQGNRDFIRRVRSQGESKSDT